ncbi:MAG: hypothetical protein CVU42_05445 [Chloroflexi bacterium HGW-Chloroflexi-4]|jgi:hypothetical protein|nr:MAG: hypothetical protein CVU45_02085 [Chloroflexi bacterium HGW-Chloroflexi-7]PKO00185.1 MAG: hypothetical protein CVU42_05445 [Chloroflexi bacterium HGW-Chloroflexi-4]
MTGIKTYFIRTLLVLFCFVLLAGCSEDDPLIGTWQEPDSGITIQFKDDGNVVMSNDKTSIILPYTTQEPNTILVKASTDGTIPDQTIIYRVEENKLILTVDGVDSVFSLVK